MTEAIKWNYPVYFLGKKNVVNLFYPKYYVGIWFMQGALLKDSAGRLVNTSPEKTVPNGSCVSVRRRRSTKS